MRYLYASFDSANKNDGGALLTNLDKLETNYYVIEPFLSEGTRSAIWEQYQQFSYLCHRLREQQPLDNEKRNQFSDSFIWYRNYFRTQLYDALFRT
jgi:hypothetical protein